MIDFQVKVVYLQSPTDQYFDSSLLQTLWKKNSGLNGWNYAEVPLYVHRPFKVNIFNFRD